MNAIAGSDNAAGIGGGDTSGSYQDFSTITITGASVTATGHSKGAGIGGGEYGRANITISGGSVTATGGASGGAGIGSGVDGTSSTITITGGIVDASIAEGSKGFGIGDGKNKKGSSTISLGWTDATRDSLRICAPSYSGTVTMTTPFASYTSKTSETPVDLFLPHAFADNGPLAGVHLKAWDGITDWTTLQRVINSAYDGMVIQLSRNITAGSADAALQVGSGKDITIDLNGFTLSRGLTGAAANGYVIQNNGTLTITDSAGGGKITGGNNTGDGGGIYNYGRLTLAGGSITGNRAGLSAGGVMNHSGAVFTVTGGTITGNTAVGWHGGGVYNGGTLDLQGGSITGNEAKGDLGSGQGGGVLNNGIMYVSEAPVVSGNTAPSGNNIYLRASHRAMTVIGALKSGANLWVTSARGTDTITSMYRDNNGTKDPGQFFHADNGDYTVVLDGLEAAIVLNASEGLKVTVRSSGYGSVTSDHAKADSGDTVKLTFIPDDEDCFVATLTIKDSNNRDVDFDREARSYVMPEASVTVSLSRYQAPARRHLPHRRFRAGALTRPRKMMPCGRRCQYHIR